MDKHLTWIYRRLIKALYDGTYEPGDLDVHVTQYAADVLWKGAQTGYGVAIEAVDFDTPDYAMLAEIESSVYDFALARSGFMSRHIGEALLDERGQLRSFADFAADALGQFGDYHTSKLRAEYNHAVAASTMAARWQDIIDEADLYPGLRYRTIGDGRVRHDHRKLDGVVRAVDSPFWDRYYPPNGWNCRCDVEPVDQRTLDRLGERPIKGGPPKIDHPMFDRNVGKDGIIFHGKHPYFQETSPDTDQYAQALKPDRKQWSDTATHVNDLRREAEARYREAVGDELYDRAAANVAKLMDNARVAISVGGAKRRMPSAEAQVARLQQIIEEGLLTLFDTATGGGSTSIERRKKVERWYFDIADGSTSRPRYGFVIGSQSPSAIARYGLIAIEVEPRLLGFTTFSGGDSFHGEDASNRRGFYPSLLRDPHPSAFVGYDETDLTARFTTIAEAEDLRSLTDTYIEAQIHAPIPPSAIRRVQMLQRMYNVMPEDLHTALDALDIPVHIISQNVE